MNDAFCFDYSKRVYRARQVLVDGPETGVARQAYRLNNLQLTKFRVKFPYHAPTRDVRKAWKNADVKAKWEASAWAQKAKDVKKVCAYILFVHPHIVST